MLEVGTKVFINYVFRQHRPSPTGYEMNLERCYGTVKSIIDITNQSIASVIWCVFAI